MGAANTARLACGFAAYGFDSVIEGLDLTEGPGTAWAETHLPGLDVRYVAVTCDPLKAIERLQQRGWNRTTKDIAGHREWHDRLRRDASGFESIVDTTTEISLRDCVNACASDLGIEIGKSTLGYECRMGNRLALGKIDGFCRLAEAVQRPRQ